MCEPMNLNRLPWDSDFWGINFYNLVESTGLCHDDVDKPYLIQSKVEKSNTHKRQCLEKNGYQCVEQKITLVQQVEKKFTKRVDIRPIKLDEIQPLQDEIGSLFIENSRYRMLDLQRVKDFYYYWLANSCSGSQDTYIDGYFIENQLTGFVSYRVKNNVLIIGLFGVLSPFQGKGIAKLLLEHVNYIAQQLQLESISVSTQASNKNALKAYIKQGFKISLEEFWYYKMDLSRGEKHDFI